MDDSERCSKIIRLPIASGNDNPRTLKFEYAVERDLMAL
jgi:hypothetical protein